MLELATKDGLALTVSYAPAEGEGLNSPPKKVALIFHGNGTLINGLCGWHSYLAKLGIASYIMEYRGFGGSPGWPSESALKSDALTLWNHAKKQTGLSAEDLIVIGESIGSGPAAYLASEVAAGYLVLLAPYTSIPEAAHTRGWLSIYTSLLWTIFPVKDYIPKLETTCVIDYHSKLDPIISVEHSHKLKALYQGSKTYQQRIFEGAAHVFAPGRIYKMLHEDLKACGY